MKFKKIKSRFKKIKKTIKSRLSLKKILVNGFKLLALLAALGSALLLATYLILKAPDFHLSYIRDSVGSRVFMIKDDAGGGGGTGFQVKAPSGVDYIVTNDHICERSEDNEILVIDKDKNSIARKILVRSNESDLCLIEGVPNLPGLAVGEAPSIGQTLAVVGHPHLLPLTVIKGEVLGTKDIDIIHQIYGNQEAVDAAKADGSCDRAPKKTIRDKELEFDFLGVPLQMKLPVCSTLIKSTYLTSIEGYPGNSGSPIVNFFGEVVGVAFSIGRPETWLMVINNADLVSLLSKK